MIPLYNGDGATMPERPHSEAQAALELEICRMKNEVEEAMDALIALYETFVAMAQKGHFNACGPEKKSLHPGFRAVRQHLRCALDRNA